jgi:CheY-like chemotaxis protein
VKTTSILVIEDNPVNMELAVAVLELDGYRVLTATDAESGIRSARENIPDLILMDIQLPGMSGLHATRIIKQDSTTQNIPVVALSAHAMKADEEEAIMAGCSVYITKPFQLKPFLEVIKKYVQ